MYFIIKKLDYTKLKNKIMTTEERDKFAIEFHRWMAKNDTQENAEKYFHYTHKDMLNEFKKYYDTKR